MHEFLDFIESIDSADLGASNLWTRDDPGYGVPITARRQRQTDAYKRALVEAVKLIDRVRAGTLPALYLQEAMSTSDFPILFGDVLDRQMLGSYQAAPPTWRRYIRTGTVRDFRKVKTLYVDGGEGQLAEVRELAEYKAASMTEGKYERQVKKYGRRMPFSFEAMVNDDMGLLTDTPRRFALAATRSETRFAISMYAGASGPNAALYTSGNKNIITGNPALTVAGLTAALTQLGSMVDSEGEPIIVEMAILVVPPALRMQALSILNATELVIPASGDNPEIRTGNYLRNAVELIVEPYLPIISSTANGNTSWYLFAPTNVARPALEFDFLRGYEAPQLFMRSPDAIRVGGGAVDPMQGSFDRDNLDYKIRHIFGGGYLDPRATMASNGTGS